MLKLFDTDRHIIWGKIRQKQVKADLEKRHSSKKAANEKLLEEIRIFIKTAEIYDLELSEAIIDYNSSLLIHNMGMFVIQNENIVA